MNLRSLAARKIEAIKARLAELAGIDTGDPAARSWKQSEADTERRNLQQESRIATRQLQPVDRARQTEHRARLERVAEQEIARRSEHAREFAAKLDREGDHRQARIWREHALEIPAQVAREMGLVL